MHVELLHEFKNTHGTSGACVQVCQFVLQKLACLISYSCIMRTMMGGIVCATKATHISLIIMIHSFYCVYTAAVDIVCFFYAMIIICVQEKV